MIKFTHDNHALINKILVVGGVLLAALTHQGFLAAGYSQTFYEVATALGFTGFMSVGPKA